MPAPIVFYDIPSHAKNKAWSPNTWKTRFCLNIKGIPYKTVWVEFPDIEAVCKKVGAKAVEKQKDGTPLYTLPVIYDPNTKEVVSNSAEIARYLDRTYPDTRQLIPPEIDALTEAFEEAFWGLFKPSLDYYPILVVATFAQVREKSKLYFRERREKLLGAKLEELAPMGSKKRAGHWEGIRRDVHRMTKWLKADGKEKLLFMGDEKGIMYPDIIVAGFFMCVKKTLGEDDAEWKDVLTWDEGRWARFLETFKLFEVVDEGQEVEQYFAVFSLNGVVLRIALKWVIRRSGSIRRSSYTLSRENWMPGSARVNVGAERYSCLLLGAGAVSLGSKQI